MKNKFTLTVIMRGFKTLILHRQIQKRFLSAELSLPRVQALTFHVLMSFMLMKSLPAFFCPE